MKENKKHICKNCVWWQIKKGITEEEKKYKEVDCINSRSPFYKDNAYADDTCPCWKERNRQNMKELKRKDRRYWKKHK